MTLLSFAENLSELLKVSQTVQCRNRALNLVIKLWSPYLFHYILLFHLNNTSKFQNVMQILMKTMQPKTSKLGKKKAYQWNFPILCLLQTQLVVQGCKKKKKINKWKKIHRSQSILATQRGRDNLREEGWPAIQSFFSVMGWTQCRPK